MNWTDNREVKNFQKANVDSPYKFETEFTQEDTYFMDPLSDNYIVEYNFENMKQFETLIQEVLPYSYPLQLIKTCEVAAMKCKVEAAEEMTEAKASIIVPDFIYNF